MARKSQKSLLEQASKVTVRFPAEVAEAIAEESIKAGIKPSVYVRIATTGFTKHKHLDLMSKLMMAYDELIRLRRDFNDALIDGGD